MQRQHHSSVRCAIAAAAAVRRSSQLPAASDEYLVRSTDGLHAVSDALEAARLLACLYRPTARHLSHLHRRTHHTSTITITHAHRSLP